MKTIETSTNTYNILEEIGRGSGGTVYKAYHTRLHKMVVLKKINNPSRSALRNRQEVDILKDLTHTYLPQVLDFFETEDGIFTVMSYIPGESLGDLVKSGRKFTRNELLKWGMQLCSALNYLHTRTIPVVHGDIKPSNIMLKPDGDICLIDFNISFFLDENIVLGYTDGYTSPEQYMAVESKRKRADSKFVINDKADIYSAGATLYYLATGLKRSNYSQDIAMDRLVEAVGEPFAEIIQKSVNVDPAQRFQSAAQMFRALESLPKRDQRYRRLLKQQKIAVASLAAGAVLFAALACFGFIQMNGGRYDEYNDLVDQQISYIQSGDFASAEKEFKEASELIPSEPEAYYQQAYSLYTQGDYERSLSFIDNDVLEKRHVKKKGQRMVDIYALAGLNHLELGNNQKAVECFEQAMDFGTFQAENYRDYAIALANNGQYDKAESMLQKAEDAGLAESAIAYTRGEISFAQQEYSAALKNFETCIATQEDSYLCMRAYLMANKVYREKNDLAGSRTLLRQAVSKLPVQEQLVILENLVQTDIDLADKTGQSSYRSEAIGYLNQIIENNWAGYSDYDTLVILYQKQNDLAQVESTLKKMESLYGDDYNIQKRYAFLEISRQAAKPQSSRNYRAFESHYNKALNQYNAGVKGKKTDQEMLLLEDTYRQLQTGGWL